MNCKSLATHSSVAWSLSITALRKSTGTTTLSTGCLHRGHLKYGSLPGLVSRCPLVNSTTHDPHIKCPQDKMAGGMQTSSKQIGQLGTAKTGPARARLRFLSAHPSESASSSPSSCDSLIFSRQNSIDAFGKVIFRFSSMFSSASYSTSLDIGNTMGLSKRRIHEVDKYNTFS